MNSGTISFSNTRFIFDTNFSGDPSRDTYGDDRRKCNLIVPDEMTVHELMDMGVKVRATKPRRDEDPNDYIPDYFVQVQLKYRSRANVPVKYPPKVYLVSGQSEPVLLDEESVGQIDFLRVKNVNAILTPYQYGANEKDVSLYIRTMYVEQDLDDDPYAAMYRRRAEMAVARDEDDMPF